MLVANAFISPTKKPRPSARFVLWFCAVRTTIRVAWLIAATLLLARIAESVINELRYAIGWYGLNLPGRPYAFTPCLNAAALLATSFAVVVTCAGVIERRVSR